MYNKIYDKALNLNFLTFEESIDLYENAELSELMWIADKIRKKINNEKIVTWLIDRNVNITNVCISRCKFCNFHCSPKSDKAYITNFQQYAEKIETLFQKGGRQLLLQGGLHPKLKIDFYIDLFKKLKMSFPELRLHALGPPEIVHISKISNLNIETTLTMLKNAGLDSLPGAGAEILCDRVRHMISPAKCTTAEWLNVMQKAHIQNISTSATMMFGHVETKQERIEHLIKIRNLQAVKPEKSVGFIAFIPWTFQSHGTVLQKQYNIATNVSANEYIRTIAISRIMLPNIQHIQASWLTVGKEVGQMCLYAGADDFGSIMIEENVVSAAGASNSFDADGIQKAISEAGFMPQLRNQQYEHLVYEK